MNTDSLVKISGYKYNEYLLVLSPPPHLHDKIMEEKEKFANKYETEIARFSKPHITLVNFVQFEMMEGRLINCLKSIAEGYHYFKVGLKDFGSFPSHTLFINIESKQQVQNLGKALRPAQHLMTLNKDNKPHFITNPHLTIARKLLPWQYEKAWIEYSHRYFTGQFIADNMALLKKPLEGKSYQVAQHFEFLNLAIDTTQGQLFT